MGYHWEKAHFILLYGAIIYFGFFSEDVTAVSPDALDSQSNVTRSFSLSNPTSSRASSL